MYAEGVTTVDMSLGDLETFASDCGTGLKRRRLLHIPKHVHHLEAIVAVVFTEIETGRSVNRSFTIPMVKYEESSIGPLLD
jgi:hypothetical protein